MPASALDRASCWCSPPAAAPPRCPRSSPPTWPPRATSRRRSGADVSMPTGTIARTIDAGKTLARAAETRMLTEEEKLQLFDAGAEPGAQPARASSSTWRPELRVRPPLGGRAALRLAAAWRLGVRRQLLVQEQSGYDLTVGAGGAALQLRLPDRQRHRHRRAGRLHPLEPGHPGGHRPARADFYRLWARAADRAVSTYSTRLVIEAPGQAGGAVGRDVAEAAGRRHVPGRPGRGGGWLPAGCSSALELTVVRMVGNAQLDVFGRRTEADTGTWIIYPGIAVLGEF